MIKLLIGVRLLRGVAVAMNKKFKSCKSVPNCFVDGLPCEHYGQCEIFQFGVMGDEVVWRCPRLNKAKGKKRVK